MSHRGPCVDAAASPDLPRWGGAMNNSTRAPRAALGVASIGVAFALHRRRLMLATPALAAEEHGESSAPPRVVLDFRDSRALGVRGRHAESLRRPGVRCRVPHPPRAAIASTSDRRGTPPARPGPSPRLCPATRAPTCRRCRLIAYRLPRSGRPRPRLELGRHQLPRPACHRHRVPPDARPPITPTPAITPTPIPTPTPTITPTPTPTPTSSITPTPTAGTPTPTATPTPMGSINALPPSKHRRRAAGYRPGLHGERPW